MIGTKTDIEILGVEELFVAQAQLHTIDAGYQELKLDTPEWVTDKMGDIDREITNRMKGELLRRLKAAKARRAALKTPEEKRGELDSEIAQLETMLK